MNAPVAVVTGANSGIGRATAIYLATKGMRVFGTVRDASKATKLLAGAADSGVTVEIAELDVADDESVRRGFAEILAKAGGVDLLVNNAGIGGNAVAEECPPSYYHEVMNVNLYGVIRCAQQVLPGMRERKRGCIVNISSIVGKFAAIGQSPYVASKFALEGVSDGMAQELAPFNIRVAVVEPGVTKSAIFAKNPDVPQTTGAYEPAYRRMFQFYAAGIPQATDPVEVAEAIHTAYSTDKPVLRYVTSWAGTGCVEGRANISDADWVGIAALENDADYHREFKRHFGVDISKH